MSFLEYCIQSTVSRQWDNKEAIYTKKWRYKMTSFLMYFFHISLRDFKIRFLLSVLSQKINNKYGLYFRQKNFDKFSNP